MPAPVRPSAAPGWGYLPQGMGGIFHPILLLGRKILMQVQTNRASTRVANQGIGTFTVAALASGATVQMTITDTLISAGSIVFFTFRYGTTTPAAAARGRMSANLAVITAGTSFTVDVRNETGAATLSTDYEIQYWIIG